MVAPLRVMVHALKAALVTHALGVSHACICTSLTAMSGSGVWRQVPLLAVVVDAWLWTASEQLGLFSQGSDPRPPTETEVGDPAVETPGDPWAVGDGKVGSQSRSNGAWCRSQQDPKAVVEHVHAQSLWLLFFWEMWQVRVGGSCLTRQDAMLLNMTDHHCGVRPSSRQAGGAEDSSRMAPWHSAGGLAACGSSSSRASAASQPSGTNAPEMRCP